MECSSSLKTLPLLLLFFSLVWLSSFHGCRANRASSWKRNPTTTLAKKDTRIQPLATVPAHVAGNQGGSTFDVRSYGAKGDGATDDTEAFQSAWAAACKVEASTVLVPAGHHFVVGPISFAGTYCQPNIVFQLDGGIIALTSPGAWGSGLLQWLEFTKLIRGITVKGQGVINGRGEVWWGSSTQSYDPALRFYGSSNVTVTGITIRNSPPCHLKFDNCTMVTVYNITISSPGNSPNTDGIHLQNSVDVVVHHSNLACGTNNTPRLTQNHK